VILHAAAIARIDAGFQDPERAAQVNTRGTALLAELAERTGARLVLVSTDLVFDGERGNYREGDPPNPLSVYGRTKADAEATVLATNGNAVARVSLLFGPSMWGTLLGRPSFFDTTVEALRTGRPVTLFTDEWRTPLALTAAAESLIALVESDVSGLLHLGGPERLSRLEMGHMLAEHLGASSESIIAARREDVPSAEPRPRDTSLDSSRWRALFPELPWPTYRESLAKMRPIN
jgi:dTDP-4-dehydrorhamnose reductase